MSLKNPISYWDSLAKEVISWKSPYTVPFELINHQEASVDLSEQISPWRWFQNGEIDILRTFFGKKNCGDILFEIVDSNFNKSDILAEDLIIHCLTLQGRLQKGKSTLIIGSSSLEQLCITIFSLLSGGTHCTIFPSLQIEAILSRIDIFKPDQICIDTRSIPRDKIESLELLARELDISTLLYDERLLEDSRQHERSDAELPLLDSRYVANLSCDSVNSSDLLFCLFTSGSTGKPKAIFHSYAGYLVYSVHSFRKFFDPDNNLKSFCCATDAAWINGHTYAIYGPLLASVRSVIVEDISCIQNPKALSDFFRKIKPDFFYTSVTMLRAIKAYCSIVSLEKIPSLGYQIKGLGSCGEPLADEVGRWAVEWFSTCNKHVVNTYFQTETGGILSAPNSDSFYSVDYSNVGKPQFPISISLDQETCSLVVDSPFPGIYSHIASTKLEQYWTDDARYILHDTGHFDGTTLYIGGRTDDVINVSGHRISSSEIESVVYLDSLFIQDVAAIGIPDPILGESVILFLVSGADQASSMSISNLISQHLSPYHLPKRIFFVSALPKTRSGKISRKLLRKIYLSLSQNLCPKDSIVSSLNQDVSTLVNIDEFVDSCAKIFN